LTAWPPHETFEMMRNPNVLSGRTGERCGKSPVSAVWKMWTWTTSSRHF